MKNTIYVLMALLATFQIMPMGWLINNPLTNKLAFLSSMRFTKTPPRFTQSCNTANTNFFDVRLKATEQQKNKIEETLLAITKLKLNPDERTSIAKEIADELNEIKDIKNSLTNDLKEYKDIHHRYNELNDKFKNANRKTQSSAFDKLSKEFEALHKFEQNLHTKYRPFFGSKLPEE